jgi:GCK domain
MHIGCLYRLPAGDASSAAGVRALTGTVEVQGGDVGTISRPCPYINVSAASDDADSADQGAATDPTALLTALQDRSVLGLGSSGESPSSFAGVLPLPSTAGDGKVHPRYAKHQAVVPPLHLSGVICPDDCYDAASGECRIPTDNSSSSSSSESKDSNSTSSSSEGSTAGEGEEVPWECPLCTMMRKSPCAAEFEEWHNCLSAVKALADAEANDGKESSGDASDACFEAALPMVRCIKAHPEIFAEMNAAAASGDEEAASEGAAAAAAVESEAAQPESKSESESDSSSSGAEGSASESS